MLRSMLWGVCVLGIGIVALPASAVVIGDFEADMDGWSAAAPGPSDTWTITTTRTQDFSPSGDWGLRIQTANGDPWNTLQFSDPAALDLVINSTRLEIDVRTPLGGITGDMGLHLILGGGDEDGNNLWHDHGYAWTGNGTWDHTSTVGWNLDPAAIAELTQIRDGGFNWWTITLATNGGGATNDFYIDNIRLILVPEPASLALLSLGGLAVATRRR